jgi:hypothetical protein
MLHVWLIPLLVIFLVVLAGFYLLIRSQGGTGVRTDGKTVVDKPGVEEDMPPS